MDAGVAIAIALSRAMESAGVARREREIADVLASGAGFVGACYREEAIAHVSRNAVESANVPWSASQVTAIFIGVHATGLLVAQPRMHRRMWHGHWYCW